MYNIHDDKKVQELVAQLNPSGQKLYKRLVRRYERGRKQIPYGVSGDYIAYPDNDSQLHACFLGVCMIGGVNNNVGPFVLPPTREFFVDAYYAANEFLGMTAGPLFTGIPCNSKHSNAFGNYYTSYSISRVQLDFVIQEVSITFDRTFDTVKRDILFEFQQENYDVHNPHEVYEMDEERTRRMLEEATYHADKNAWHKLIEHFAVIFNVDETVTYDTE